MAMPDEASIVAIERIVPAYFMVPLTSSISSLVFLAARVTRLANCRLIAWMSRRQSDKFANHHAIPWELLVAEVVADSNGPHGTENSLVRGMRQGKNLRARVSCSGGPFG